MKYVWGFLVTPNHDTEEPNLYSSNKKAMAVFDDRIKTDKKMGLQVEVATNGKETSAIITQPKTRDQIFYSVKKIKVR